MSKPRSLFAGLVLSIAGLLVHPATFAGEEGTPCPYLLSAAGGAVQCGWPWPTVNLHPRGLNKLGNWVGYREMCPAEGDFEFIAVKWTPETGVQSLPLPPDTTTSFAYAINDCGTAVGWRSGTEGGLDGYWGCIWIAGVLIEVPHYPGSSSGSFAFAVNNSNVVVGYRDVDRGDGGQPETKGFVWTDGKIVDIDPIPNAGNRAEARAISDTGIVVGLFGLDNTDTGRAFRWRDGRTELLDMLAGAVTSNAHGVNDSGMTVGSCRFDAPQPPGYHYQPTIWSADGVPSPLPLLPEYASGTGTAINDAGVILGYMYQPTQSGLPSPRRAVWINGVPYYVTASLEVPNASSFGGPMALNELGQILASGPSAPTGVGGWILTPTQPLADLNNDCIVDGTDLQLLLGAWGSAGPSGFDLNHDGKVDGADLGNLLGAWTVR